MGAKIIQEMGDYIGPFGGAPSAWYVGIASDAVDCLFNRHSVRQATDAWIYRDAGSDTLARAIEKAFLDAGYAGGGGGGDSTTRFVYAYRIATHTRE